MSLHYLLIDFAPFDDDELPPLIDPNDDNNFPFLISSGRNIAMPSECTTTNPLQRALADSIIRMVSLDELRILLACGAKVNKSFSAFSIAMVMA